MKVAIVGYATEGKVSAAYYKKRGHNVTICDANSQLEVEDSYEKRLGSAYLEGLEDFDLVVRTAGMHPKIILEKNPGLVGRTTTAIQTFLEHCPTKNIIGVTGTKGKGTTSSLIAKILEASGKTVWLGGNIGTSPLTFIDDIQQEDYVVLELSSFQLIDLRARIPTAVCLMVVPEHLNWHQDYKEYVIAKQQLFSGQSEDDTAIYFAGNEVSRSIAETSHAHKVPYYAAPGAYIRDETLVIEDLEIISTSEIALRGAHNWQNTCAAVTAVWAVGIKEPTFTRTVLKTFTGLEHRIEFVREFEDIKYYDDSFGTTPETAVVALQAFSEPKVIILGGSDKGARYDELARAVAESSVQAVILIGNQANAIRKALDSVGFKKYAYGGDSMQEIVQAARDHAESGNIVLLSTGCASFDMFSDYKDRGNQFKSVVNALN